MNLTLIKQKKIRGYFLINSPEYLEVIKLKEEIGEILYNIVLNSLSTSEKWIMENLTSDEEFNTFNGLRISAYSSEEVYDNIFGFKVPTCKMGYCWNNNLSTTEIYNILCEFKVPEKKKSLPDIVSSSWEEIKKLDENEFSKIQESLKRIITFLEILEDKIFQLDRLLNSDISLKDVKKYFPELYKKIKE